MANIYYKKENSKIYYCNEQKTGYTLWDYNVTPPISRGYEVVIEYDNTGYFHFPSICSGLFQGITNESFSLGNYYVWDMSEVRSTYMMFASATNLKRINGGRLSWDLTNVTSMSYMFSGCSSLEEFPTAARNINTSQVQSFRSVFSGCASLADFTFLENWNTSNVTDMTAMFNGCSSMTYIDISNWDMSNVSLVSSMFSNCSNLETIKVKPWTNWNDGSKVDSGGNLFVNDTKLPNWNRTYGIVNAHANYGGYFTYDHFTTQTKIYLKV